MTRTLRAAALLAGLSASSTSWAKAQEEPVVTRLCNKSYNAQVLDWKIYLHSSSTLDNPMKEFSGSILPDFLSYERVYFQIYYILLYQM